MNKQLVLASLNSGILYSLTRICSTCVCQWSIWLLSSATNIWIFAGGSCATACFSETTIQEIITRLTYRNIMADDFFVLTQRGLLWPCSHDAGTKLCQHKMNTVCNCSHNAGSMSVSSLFSFLVWTLPWLLLTIFITAKIFRQTVMKLLRLRVWIHSTETVEFRYGFKLLRLAFRFQTLTVSVTVSQFRSVFKLCRYRVNGVCDSIWKTH